MLIILALGDVGTVDFVVPQCFEIGILKIMVGFHVITAGVCSFQFVLLLL
jgi:hypothetical protein